MRPLAPAMLVMLLAFPAPLSAEQVWIGLYEHDIVLAQTGFEKGQDLKAGWIGRPIQALSAVGSPSPHLLLSVGLQGQTDYAAAGLNWTFGRTLYARPGIGIAIHNGPSYATRENLRVDLGSRVLFEPELAFGWRLSDTFAVDASWIHLSHATLFSSQNRGLDSWGLRILWRPKARN